MKILDLVVASVELRRHYRHQQQQQQAVDDASNNAANMDTCEVINILEAKTNELKKVLQTRSAFLQRRASSYPSSFRPKSI
jgi:hypothetical protein